MKLAQAAQQKPRPAANPAVPVKKPALPASAKSAAKASAPVAVKPIKKTALPPASAKVDGKKPAVDGQPAKKAKTRPSPEPAPLAKKPTVPAAEAIGPEIPSSYKETYLHAIARDPQHIFTFWEVAPEMPAPKGPARGEKTGRPQPVLRLFTMDSQGENRVADFPVSAAEGERYVAVPQSDSGRYRLEYGLLTRSGAFRKICASNEVEIPRIPPREQDNSIRGQVDSIDEQTNSPRPAAPVSPILDYLGQKIHLPGIPVAPGKADAAEVTHSAGSLDFVPQEVMNRKVTK